MTDTETVLQQLIDYRNRPEPEVEPIGFYHGQPYDAIDPDGGAHYFNGVMLSDD